MFWENVRRYLYLHSNEVDVEKVKIHFLNTTGEGKIKKTSVIHYVL